LLKDKKQFQEAISEKYLNNLVMLDARQIVSTINQGKVFFQMAL